MATTPNHSNTRNLATLDRDEYPQAPAVQPVHEWLFLQADPLVAALEVVGQTLQNGEATATKEGPGRYRLRTYNLDVTGSYGHCLAQAGALADELWRAGAAISLASPPTTAP